MQATNRLAGSRSHRGVRGSNPLSSTRIPRPAPTKELSELTERELEILRLIATGRSNAEIGRTLFIGETTVKTHVTHILQKLGLHDRVQAVVLAYQAGLFAQAHSEC